MNKLYQKVSCYSQINCQLRKLLFTSATNRTVDKQASVQHELRPSTNMIRDLSMKIKLAGPISVASYMKYVLTHPMYGYYTSNDVFGSKGDFTTSPEISQLFGEMIAVWIISECQKLHDRPFQIVELGPGRGTLSKDIIRVFRQLRYHNRISLHLVEVSPALASIQKKILCPQLKNTVDLYDDYIVKHYKKAVSPEDVEVYWYRSITDIPQEFSVFIAQEFFDALPIHKFQKTKDGWFEVLVDNDPTSNAEDKFRFVLSKTQFCELIDPEETKDHLEISLEAINIMKYISAAMTENGGFSLFIDYGHNGDKGDTFRAFRQHKQCDPLSEPGTADLTADVDFALLKKVAFKAKKLLCFGPVTQRNFLTEMGIDVRLQKLCSYANENQRKQLQLGYDKIMSSNEMGDCFKVVSMFPYVLKQYLDKFPVHGFDTYDSKKEE